MIKLKRAYDSMARNNERRALVERPHNTEHNNAFCLAQVLALEDAGARDASEQSRRTNPGDRVHDP